MSQPETEQIGKGRLTDLLVEGAVFINDFEKMVDFVALLPFASAYC